MIGVPDNNLLLALHKYASRQDENFLTEAFAHLLRHLAHCEPRAAASILKKLAGGVVTMAPDETDRISITTQIVISSGRPDIEIRSRDWLIYVEVKAESGLGESQLKRYQEALKNSGMDRTSLILLTRYPVLSEKETQLADAAIRWYQVAQWLEREKVEKPESTYLLKQFLEFLRSRGMTMERVSWELARGVKSLRSLIEMVGESLAALEISSDSNRTCAWEWIGYYLESKPRRFFVGISYQHPNLLEFDTQDFKIDKAAYEELGIGRIQKDQYFGEIWVNELDLASEEVHFFALSKTTQMQRVESFIKQSLDAARQIEAGQ